MNNLPILTTRYREIWTRAERKILDRAAQLMAAHGDQFMLICGKPMCPEPSMHIEPYRQDADALMLRCGCTDRVFSAIH